MVAGHAQRCSGVDRFHHQSDDLGTLGAAVNQITKENELAPGGVMPRSARLFAISQLSKQLGQLIVAIVNVADDVERSVLVLPVTQ